MTRIAVIIALVTAGLASPARAQEAFTPRPGDRYAPRINPFVHNADAPQSAPAESAVRLIAAEEPQPAPDQVPAASPTAQPTHTRPPAEQLVPEPASAEPAASEETVAPQQLEPSQSDENVPTASQNSLRQPLAAPGAESADEAPNSWGLPANLGGPEEWISPQGISSAIQMLGLLAVVSLAPAILMMTTCFVRIVVVLGLLRQALGTQQLPPNQVMTSIAVFMTVLIMSPVWTRVYNDAIKPYTSEEITLSEAWEAGVKPVRQFMSAQIDRTGNRDDIWLFYKYLPQDTPAPASYDDVPLTVLLPAFMLSELKTAFLIGFQIYLPFLVLDLVVSSVTISMGMVMLPPVMVSLPLKLLLFVLVDGWHLVVGMLLDSFQAFS
jgi:flagellar biosynthetic protein FliP